MTLFFAVCDNQVEQFFHTMNPSSMHFIVFVFLKLIGTTNFTF